MPPSSKSTPSLIFDYLLPTTNFTSTTQVDTLNSLINMKFSTSVILALASSLIAASPISLPTRQANPDGVLATINTWLNDISVSNSPCLRLLLKETAFPLPSLLAVLQALIYTFQL